MGGTRAPLGVAPPQNETIYGETHENESKKHDWQHFFDGQIFDFH